MLSAFAARSFRNLENESLELHPGRHLILGPNGAGKTSLLEAFYVLATTRSFRAARLQECARHGEPAFFLRGQLADGRQFELYAQADKSEKRLNGHRAALADYLATQPVVAWTSADLEILLGAPVARRRFLDRGVVGRRPAMLLVLSRYRQALDEKRRLLAVPGFGDAEMEPWNLLLAEAAAELIAQRATLVEKLAVELARLHQDIDLDLPPVNLRYKSSPRHGLEGSATIAESLERCLEQERVLRQPLQGPHRDELEITWDDHPIRRVASAGERKALGLLLTLAFARVLEAEGLRPLYLLDDLDAELDRKRLLRLWRLFEKAPEERQVFVTSNRPEVWSEAAVERRWSCERGQLR